MRAAWRLATNSLSGRRSRSALLIGAVALSGALVVTVACAIATINATLSAQLDQTVGLADARVKPAGGGRTLDSTLLDRVRAWPEVFGADGRLEASLAVTIVKPVLRPDPAGGFVRRETPLTFTLKGQASTEPRAGAEVIPAPRLLEGRRAQAPDEIVLDELLAADLLPRQAAGDRPADGWQLRGRPAPTEGPSGPMPERVDGPEEAAAHNGRLRLGVGESVEVVRQLFDFRVPIPLNLPALRQGDRLTVVGIAEAPPLAGRSQGYMTVEGLARVAEAPGRLSQIDIRLNRGVDAEALVRARRGEIASTDPGLILETTARVTSGLDENVRSSQLGFVLASVMAFLSAAFIVMTGLTTSVTERQRELAIVRCIGGTRAQLAGAQLWIGSIVGAMGAGAGVPLGIGFAALLAWVFREQLATSLAIPASGITLALVGCLVSGLIGAGWPAWCAARATPLRGLASRAAPPRPRTLLMVTIAGLCGLATQLAIVGLPTDGQVIFWGYATTGLPLMFIGYFLLGVPVTLALVRALGAPLSRLLGLPPRVLARTIEATPYRHGFTAGALMAGLALMVAIWTNGGAILRDWIGKIQFPDAFVSGLALTPESQRLLDAMPIVRRTCAVTIHPVETDVFGVRALQSYKTNFMAFEPEPFFAMNRLEWVEGDPEVAIRRLNEGGAVVVAREFLVARGLGLGHRFVARQDGVEHTFEIVGVVSSPGLEIVSKFFNIGDDYLQQSVHAVFGSRRDLREKFHSDAIHLIQIQLADPLPPGLDDDGAVAQIRRALFGAGILDAGSGRQVKEEIRSFATGMLLVVSGVAMVSMLVASFGVANLIVAGIQARQFEFGVLRAVGGTRGLLVRLVLGEALVIALTACVLGVLMGTQGSWAGQRIHRYLFGLDMHVRPPPGPIAVACLIVIALALGAALPAVLRLNRRRPRELLAAVRG